MEELGDQMWEEEILLDYLWMELVGVPGAVWEEGAWWKMSCDACGSPIEGNLLWQEVWGANAPTISSTQSSVDVNGPQAPLCGSREAEWGERDGNGSGGRGGALRRDGEGHRWGAGGWVGGDEGCWVQEEESLVQRCCPIEAVLFHLLSRWPPRLKHGEERGGKEGGEARREKERGGEERG